ncbi:MAG: SpoVR family protein [Candidatus Vogelbacteria bacterium]|nr:SpoVR family protein [Candidatus Vogelbacteria bacterium]
MGTIKKFPTDLKCHKYEIERIGRRLGYKCRPIIYEMVDSEHMSELAAFSGYPQRYHHWTFGQESYQLKTKLTKFDMGTIYEMVVPTHPCYAYLLETNLLVDHKAVMAHVIGHKDFFDNNQWFTKGVPDNMHSLLAENANVIDELRAEIGRVPVDRFIEWCMSIDNMIDILDPSIKRLPVREKTRRGKKKDKREPSRVKVPNGLPAYLDNILNPPELVKEKQKQIDVEEKRESDIERGLIIPESPVRDIMGFLCEHASLEPWQSEILRIIHQESHDLWVGAQTQIMNEGWASISESDIMVGECAGDASEMCTFAKHYSGVLRPNGGIQPYLLGRDLWQDIRWRWDTGRHGPLHDDCDHVEIVDRWDEFAAFKMIVDRHGIDNVYSPAFVRDWTEFCTLISMTQNDEGATPAAFFLKENWINEWLALRNADKTVEDFRRKLTKASLADQEITSRMDQAKLPSDSPMRFKFRYEICKQNRFDSDLDWTEEEITSKLDYLEKLRRFRKRFDEGVLKKVLWIIPDSWIEWARKYPAKIELGRGREKMFEVRETYNDVSFIREFFTPDFCEKKGFFTIGVGKYYDQNTYRERDVYVAKSKDFEKIRDAIISSRLNVGQPKIELVDANLNNNRELLLVYRSDGRGDIGPHEDIPQVLFRLYHVWGHNKPIHLETIRTIYPAKRSPWDDWRPGGRVGPVDEGPIRQIIRWTLKGITYEEKEIEFKNAHPLTQAIYQELVSKK